MINDTIQSVLESDRSHVWHPYASINSIPPLPVTAASGTKLYLADGRELIDGISSWWTAAHGHRHPAIIAAMAAQMQQMPHVMFGGLTHEPAVKLAQRLAQMLPPPLDTVFFSDSGSVSVEVAIKMAVQYNIARGCPQKHKILTVRGGYHGDTFATMALSDPVNGMHAMFRHLLPQHLFAPKPQPNFGEIWQDNAAAELRRIVEISHPAIAAVIIEPIFQGAGGMHFYSPGYLRYLEQLCREFDILLICDEIATGFGRTGKMFAIEYAGIVPDIICLGKALTGGCISLAATVTNKTVAHTIACGSPGILLHGPTYMANPVACAAANASLQLFGEYQWQANVNAIEAQMRHELAPAAALPNVADVRVLGAIGVIETLTPVNNAKLTQFFVDNGVWLRPFGNYIYLMPPFVIGTAELSKLTGAAVHAAAASGENNSSSAMV